MNKEKDLALAIGIQAGCFIVVAIVLGIMLHLHNSLVNSIDLLHYCESEGAYDCHIERDGFDYNVYSTGEYYGE